MATTDFVQQDLAFGNVKLSWTRTSVDLSANTSTISYELSIYRSGSISSSSAKNYSIVFNGATVATGTTTVGGSGTKIIRTGSTVIQHNPDGSKSFNFSFYLQLGITWSGSTIASSSASKNSTLDPIARTSKHTLSASSALLGNSINIFTNRQHFTYTHTLTYTFGKASGTIATNVATSFSWTLPPDLAHQIPNSTSGTGTIKCITYNGSTKIGEHSVNFTAVVPDLPAYNPSISSIGFSEANSAVTIGAYVQNMSRLNGQLNGVSTKYSATVMNYRIYIEDSVFKTLTFTTDTLKSSGSIPVSASVTDSRGRVFTLNTAITVLAYSPPQVTSFTTFRANADGTANQLGTNVRFNMNAASSSLVVSTERNNLKYTIKAKERAMTTWTTMVAQVTHNSLALALARTVSGFDITKSYDLRVEVADIYNTTIVLGVISSGQVTMSWGRTGVGVGKVWEQGSLDAEGEIFTAGKRVTAIHEMGENANGSYIKYVDGTMMCWLSVSPTTVSLTSAYGSFYTGTYTWTFPSTFVGSPSVQCSAFRWGTSAGFGTIAGAPSTTSVTLRGLDIAVRNTGTATYISAFAIGRWKV